MREDGQSHRFAVLAVLAVALAPRTAHANSAMGLEGLAELAMIVIGGAAALLAVALGLLSWRTALRPPTAAGWVFARGFLGVSAVLAFGIAGLCFAFGFTDLLKSATPIFLGLLGVLVMAFLALEFLVAARLYARSHAHRPSLLAQVLRIASFVCAWLFTIVAGLTLVLTLIAHFVPDQPDHSADIRRYQRGCDDGDGADCNMLGMNLRNISDMPGAIAAFERGCQLGTPLACGNLAAQYHVGEGVASSSARAGELRRRQKELEAGEAR